jgi:hypothetical protein
MSLSLIEDLDASLNTSRPVNSGVRRRVESVGTYSDSLKLDAAPASDYR